MFSAQGPSVPTPILLNAAYPANKLILPNIIGGSGIGNPQNYYNPTTGRFTPLTAGFYQVNAYTYNSGGNDYQWLKLYKNGVEAYAQAVTNDSQFGSGIQIATVIYMNGSTDYLEMGSYYGAAVSTPVTAPNFDSNTRFSAALINQTLTEVVGTTAAGSVCKSVSQAIASATFTKVTLNSVSADPQSWWNAANSRWIPTIPGYYQVDAMLTYNLTTNGLYEAHIVRNGFTQTNILMPANSAISGFVAGTLSAVVYMNGSTDYLELYTFQNSGVSQNVDGNTLRTNFAISLVGANQAVEAVTQTTSAYGIGSPSGSTPYAVAQLDNLKIWFQGQNPAALYFATVSGSTQLQGSLSTAWYGGGGGSTNINNTTGSGPLTVTAAGVSNITTTSMGTITYVFRDLTANISYRATFILQHGYTNSQCFLERIGGQQI
jgi:hypothetical protein